MCEPAPGFGGVSFDLWRFLAFDPPGLPLFADRVLAVFATLRVMPKLNNSNGVRLEWVCTSERPKTERPSWPADPATWPRTLGPRADRAADVAPDPELNNSAAAKC